MQERAVNSSLSGTELNVAARQVANASIGFARIPEGSNPCAGCRGAEQVKVQLGASDQLKMPPSVSMLHARLSLIAKWGSRVETVL